ncbi:SH3 domain-containing protein [Nocardioides sp. BGMRC 2183]|nr:SH3 domain-containing protein [Nocardioides sp. BGMRC 2183]
MATSHKRETARRKPRAAAIAGPLAVLATGAAVTIGVLATGPSSSLTALDSTNAAAGIGSAAGERKSDERATTRDREVVSRDVVDRTPLVALSPVEQLMTDDAVAKAINNASAKQWTTETLNLWTRPDDQAKNTGEIEESERVLVTGRSFGDRVEIVVDDKAYWVTAGYLDEEKPAIASVDGQCTNGTTIDSGVSASIVKIHQAVCSGWPSISTYGTLRGGGGDHGSGRAVDIMVSGGMGWEVAEFLRENYSAFGISYIIYEQQIWSVERSGEGWRGMEDRGSVTANHFDHVHVSVY